jgi:outer membrane receptor protein involved in Fe transport
VHITPRFDLQLGGRESRYTLDYGLEATGPLALYYYGSSPYIPAEEHSEGSPFTYLITARFRITPDLMVYARVATGYRIGGPNPVAAPGIPSSYKPDTTTDYEIGVKGDVLERRVTFDAAAYYISWKDFQIGEIGPLNQYFEGNAGDAKSQGLEASIQTHLLDGLTISMQGSYNRAILTQNLPQEVVAAGTYGLAGDRLPYSVPWSAGIVVDQNIPLSKDWTGLVGGDINYLGSRLAEFAPASTVPRIRFPAYTAANLHAGARCNSSWFFNLYVNNVANKRGTTGIAYSGAASGGYYTTIIQPRTVGLSITRSF